MKRFLVTIFNGRRNLIEIDLNGSKINDVQKLEVEYLLSNKSSLALVLNTLGLMDWVPFQMPTQLDSNEQLIIVFVTEGKL